MAGDSAKRKTNLKVIRWLSLPMAAFVVIAPAWSAYDMAERYSRMVHTGAYIIESKLWRAGSRGLGVEWDLYVRYPIEGGRQVESNLRVRLNSFRDPRPGQKISVFVDPKSHRAEDDLRLESYCFAGLGLLGGALVYGVGFYATGKVLRTLEH